MRSQLWRLVAKLVREAPSMTSLTSGVGSRFLPAIHRRTGDSGVTTAMRASLRDGAVHLGWRRSGQPCATRPQAQTRLCTVAASYREMASPNLSRQPESVPSQGPLLMPQRALPTQLLPQDRTDVVSIAGRWSRLAARLLDAASPLPRPARVRAWPAISYAGVTPRQAASPRSSPGRSPPRRAA